MNSCRLYPPNHHLCRCLIRQSKWNEHTGAGHTVAHLFRGPITRETFTAKKLEMMRKAKRLFSKHIFLTGTTGFWHTVRVWSTCCNRNANNWSWLKVLMSNSAAQKAHSWIRARPSLTLDCLIHNTGVPNGQGKGHHSFRLHPSSLFS